MRPDDDELRGMHLSGSSARWNGRRAAAAAAAAVSGHVHVRTFGMRCNVAQCADAVVRLFTVWVASSRRRGRVTQLHE